MKPLASTGAKSRFPSGASFLKSWGLYGPALGPPGLGALPRSVERARAKRASGRARPHQDGPFVHRLTRTMGASHFSLREPPGRNIWHPSPHSESFVPLRSRGGRPGPPACSGRSARGTKISGKFRPSQAPWRKPGAPALPRQAGEGDEAFKEGQAYVIYVKGDLPTVIFRVYNSWADPSVDRPLAMHSLLATVPAASSRPGAAGAVPPQPAGDFAGVTSAGRARRGRALRATGRPRRRSSRVTHVERARRAVKERRAE